VDATGIRVAVIGASWQRELVDAMIERAAATAAACGADFDEHRDLFRVAGSGELPVFAQAVLSTGSYEALAAYGVVVRGGTRHFETVDSRASQGLLRVSLDSGIPVGDGVLAVYDIGQAAVRSGGFPDVPGAEDKGTGAMLAALSTAVTIRDLLRRTDSLAPLVGTGGDSAAAVAVR
jgi:6,7-dimethyl-8-ribityllumazine synthase